MMVEKEILSVINSLKERITEVEKDRDYWKERAENAWKREDIADTSILYMHLDLRTVLMETEGLRTYINKNYPDNKDIIEMIKPIISLLQKQVYGSEIS